MNGCIAIWNGKQIEVYSDTSYHAQLEATKQFQKSTRKTVKSYDVDVFLCEKDGKEVSHTADF